ncbi:MAG TPA: hypothetical protein VF592_03720 [Sphingomonas sp.]|jgi:hypothetical protein|uniref:spike base protein, RCAP_Rcc01079 family n=1 Tax=Sphingomonas sp. TaxID=28214 RepID=UPI002ED93FA1
MPDKFAGYADSVDSPAATYQPVVKGPGDLPTVTKALLVGVAGTANLVQPDGTQRDNVPLQQGYNPLRVLKVLTGGTADNIWALS